MNDPVQLLAADGEPIPLAWRVNRRARRISLKVDNASGQAVLVLPTRRALAEGLRFAETQVDWLRRHLDQLGTRQPFRDGATVPVEGMLVRIAATAGRRRELLADDVLHVPAEDPELTALRVRRWLKLRAGVRLRERVAAHAEQLDVGYGRVTMRDQRTRWGSCSQNGALSFSWRLILAPPAVLDYVAAHEVAHLREMNHSRAFWNHVAKLCPDHARQRHWLRQHGPDLHRYG
ncbi:MAG: SprT family zinc-dependent metalloprotease [Alphaproteobacteria bacterium]